MRAVGLLLALAAVSVSAQNRAEEQQATRAEFIRQMSEDSGMSRREIGAFQSLLEAKLGACSLDARGRRCELLTELWMDDFEVIRSRISAKAGGKSQTQPRQ